jgi:hypothetical protein
MFSLKTRKTYQSPCTKVTEVDLEGLICQSLRFNVRARSLENMNDPDDPAGVSENASEVFYFES